MLMSSIIRYRIGTLGSRFEATASQDKFGQFLASLPTDKPVLLVDFPAQATENILTFSAHFHMLEEFERLAIRPTLLIFTADDSTAKKCLRYVGVFRDQSRLHPG